MKDGTVLSYLFNFKIHFMKVQIQQTRFLCLVSTGVVTVRYRYSGPKYIGF